MEYTSIVILIHCIVAGDGLFSSFIASPSINNVKGPFGGVMLMTQLNFRFIGASFGLR